MPTFAQDDAAQNARVANLFHNGVDVLFGIATGDDSAAWRRADGLAGPANTGQGYYQGADGNLYPRGINSAANAAAPATGGGLTITPGMLLLIGLAFLILRK